MVIAAVMLLLVTGGALFFAIGVMAIRAAEPAGQHRLRGTMLSTTKERKTERPV